jgi:hypothetical protein
MKDKSYFDKLLDTLSEVTNSYKKSYKSLQKNIKFL